MQGPSYSLTHSLIHSLTHPCSGSNSSGWLLRRVVRRKATRRRRQSSRDGCALQCANDNSTVDERTRFAASTPWAAAAAALLAAARDAVNTFAFVALLVDAEAVGVVVALTAPVLALAPVLVAGGGVATDGVVAGVAPAAAPFPIVVGVDVGADAPAIAVPPSRAKARCLSLIHI